MNSIDNGEIREELEKISTAKYKKFSENITPGTNNILGVRIPDLRKVAKEIVKLDWRKYLENAVDNSFEEVLLQGFVIGYSKCTVDKKIKYISDFIPKINNWAICDSFVTTLKFIKKERVLFWDFLQGYVNSDKEYFERFAIVVMIDYYIDEEYLNKVTNTIDTMQLNGYYAKMAAAWAIAECFAKYPNETMPYLKNNNLDKETYRKTLQKITESLKVDSDTKNIIREMKKII